MSGGDFLNIQPLELRFPFELGKRGSCSLQLTNKTNKYVAFKLQSTYPIKYGACPNTGIVLPGTTCDVTVTMAAPKEAPQDMQCEDLFLIQSVIAPKGATAKDITPEMIVELEKQSSCSLQLVPEGSSRGASGLANGNQGTYSLDAVTFTLYLSLIFGLVVSLLLLLLKLKELKTLVGES
ncbi:hypothetical protein MKW92_047327 [Papaver armeniacum]|nr:hypothetical protein MKW92_047327 [Papaver armeniacum]